MSRKHRGYKTQRLVADYLRIRFPHCKAVGAGESGADILDTPGYAIEVKARSRLDIPGGLKQARQNAGEADIPVLIVRLNGQGEKSVGKFAVIMELENFRGIIDGVEE